MPRAKRSLDVSASLPDGALEVEEVELLLKLEFLTDMVLKKTKELCQLRKQKLNLY